MSANLTNVDVALAGYNWERGTAICKIKRFVKVWLDSWFYIEMYEMNME